MADTQPIRKFMFDRSFDGAAGAAPRPRPPVTLKSEQVDAMKKESYDAGFAAGRKVAADEHAETVKTILTQIDAKIAGLVANIQTIQRDNDTMLRKAVMTIIGKIVPDLAAREGLQEIQAMLGSVISDMLHEPRLVVRVHESQFDAINLRIQEVAAQKAYAGKVIVLADAATALGDCRIEWADGGIERNVKAQLDAVETIVNPDSQG